MPEITSSSLRAVDFFCGAGGMSYGLHRAGLKILGGIDNDPDCRATYEANIPGARYIRHDIGRLTSKELGHRLGITRDDNNLVFAGCSPCQFWSKIRTDKRKSKKTAFLLGRFQKFIRYYWPGYVVIENVPGLKRVHKKSILPDFIRFLEHLGYAWSDGIINACQYGVPQRRLRYLLIATRLRPKIELPAPSGKPPGNVRDYLGPDNGFARIPAGHRDSSDFLHTANQLSETNLRRIRTGKGPGAGRLSWAGDRELQVPAYRGRPGIFRDVYSRMYWDRPAPTITTRFNSFSNGRFGHPDEDRAISLREGATLQSFPKHFVFRGSNLASLARQIGNAVPPALATSIGEHLIVLSRRG